MSQPDDNESIVPMHSFEHIPAMNLPGIDLIEKLHENKSCKHQGGMLCGDTKCFWCEAIFHIHQVITMKNQHKGNNDLKKDMANSITDK